MYFIVYNDNLIQDSFRMTREWKKDRERSFVQEATKLLPDEWKIQEHEAPDFIIRESSSKFGLEVTCVFTDSGHENSAGSKRVEEEKYRERQIHRLLSEFRMSEGMIINLQFLRFSNSTEITSEEIDDIRHVLSTEQVDQRKKYYEKFLLRNGGKIRIAVYPSPNGNLVQIVDDMVGFVDQRPQNIMRPLHET